MPISTWLLEDDTPPPALTIRVCDSLTCEMLGGAQLLMGLKAKLGDKVRVVRAPCMGRCEHAPVAEVGHYHLDNATVDGAAAAAASGHTHPEIPAYEALDPYLAGGGYQLLRDCRAGKRTADELITIMESSGLRGLGGAGFPSGRKWRFVRQEAGAPADGDQRRRGRARDHQGPRLSRDRSAPLSRGHADRGAGWSKRPTSTSTCATSIRRCARSAAARSPQLERGPRGTTRIHLRRGAGAYICGEESAMLESIEGKRGCRGTSRPSRPRSACSAGRH
jgi:formate dehydrogenase